MSRGMKAATAKEDALQVIKQTALMAMFSDDELFDLLVLKGGNAMDLIHQTHARASVDLDFSLEDDLDVDVVGPRIERVLRERFADKGYRAFDIQLCPRPGKMPEALSEFWGGYEIAFKLISMQRAEQVNEDLEMMRREAIRLGGQNTKFTIDISRYEYTQAKQPYEIEGMTIYAYPPEMIVCEKLRAICQQMPEYGPVIQRTKPGHQRARDFIDIDVLLTEKSFKVDLAEPRVQDMLRQVFEVKRVPLALLGKIPETRAFHAQGYPEVKAAMKPGIPVKPFDAYFDAVVKACGALEALWKV